MRRLATAVFWLLAPGACHFDLFLGDEPDADPGIPVSDAMPYPDAALPPDADVSDCSVPLSCNFGMQNRFHICGRVYDIETSEPLGAGIQVTFYDALAFANSAPGTRPNPLHTTTTDLCGRFTTKDAFGGTGLTVPNTTFIAVATDDDPATGLDSYVLTGVALPGAFNNKVENLSVFATRHDTDALWSDQIFGAGAPTFSERGVYLAIFVDPTKPPAGPLPGAPVAGVTVTEGGAVKTANDYPFVDTEPLIRRQVASNGVSGANGSVLYLNGPLTMFSGAGAVPSGCVGWPSTLAACVQGVVFVQIREAEGCR